MRGRFHKRASPCPGGGKIAAGFRWRVFRRQAHATIDEEIDRLIHVLRATKPGSGRIFFDHFEEAYTSDARADLSDLPQSLPDGVEVLVSTRSQRLLGVAAGRAFDIVPVPGLGPAERAFFRARPAPTSTASGLTTSRPGRSSPRPLRSASAHWCCCLDELRRYGPVSIRSRGG